MKRPPKQLIVYLAIVLGIGMPASAFGGTPADEASGAAEVKAVPSAVRLFPFHAGGRDGKWGYINREGSVVIRPRFDRAEDFSDGRARVDEGDRQAYIDQKGRVVFAIPEDWTWADSFSEGMASFHVGGTCGFVDRDFNIVVRPKYDWARDFSDGVAWVNSGFKRADHRRPLGRFRPVIDHGKWGLIDKRGRELIQPRFSAVTDFSDGMARVRLEEVYVFIDKKGRIAFRIDYSSDDPSTEICWIGRFSEALAPASISRAEGPYTGFVNRKGEFVIPPQYHGAREFREGAALVDLGQRFGWIDRSGRFVLKPQPIPKDVPGCQDFSEGLAVAAIGNQYGYVDKHLRIAIHPTAASRTTGGLFNEAEEFNAGLARVHIGGTYASRPTPRWLGGAWYYINRKGEVVHLYKQDPEFADLWPQPIARSTTRSRE